MLNSCTIRPTVTSLATPAAVGGQTKAIEKLLVATLSAIQSFYKKELVSVQAA
jgi:hypothetical protein